MIPGKIARFLEQYANIGFAGTRDRDLVPHGHRVVGWVVGADLRTMTIFAPEEFTPGLVERLQDNGELSVTIDAFPSHETYQFKGRYRSHRAAGREDGEAVDRVRGRFVRSVRTVFGDVPDDMLRNYTSPPSLAVEFEVEEIYLQTPGPGAGTRLVPPAEG